MEHLITIFLLYLYDQSLLPQRNTFNISKLASVQRVTWYKVQYSKDKKACCNYCRKSTLTEFSSSVYIKSRSPRAQEQLPEARLAVVGLIYIGELYDGI